MKEKESAPLEGTTAAVTPTATDAVITDRITSPLPAPADGEAKPDTSTVEMKEKKKAWKNIKEI